jgi:hypothetical protein
MMWTGVIIALLLSIVSILVRKALA